MKRVQVMNMTSLFDNDMLLYSFFDIRLTQPLKIITVFYFILLFLIVGVPIIIVTWPLNVYSFMIAFGIPLGGSIAMSKPIWNGKSFFSFFKAQMRYILRPKVLYDWRGRPKGTIYRLNSKILVSREKDYIKLYKVVKGGK